MFCTTYLLPDLNGMILLFRKVRRGSKSRFYEYRSVALPRGASAAIVQESQYVCVFLNTGTKRLVGEVNCRVYLFKFKGGAASSV